MATIYSGIHLKLKSYQVPWPEKLKLAQFAWTSEQCLLPNKEQVLLDWASNALNIYYSKKTEVALEIVEGLWTYLNDILHSKKLSHVLAQGKTITLRLVVPQMVNKSILESISGDTSVSLHTVLSCCHGILTSPALSVTYTAKYELLVELLARLCRLSSIQLLHKQPESCLSLKVFELLQLVLSTYLTVQKQQPNSKRVFSQVTTHLLYPLLLLRHLLNTRVWTEYDDLKIRQNLSREIRSKVDAVLHSALFCSDNLQYYKDEVLPLDNADEKKEKATKKPSLCPVNDILSAFCIHDNGESLLYAVKTNSFPLLFKLALDSFPKGDENKQVIFHLMTKLIIALGFTKDLEVEEKFDTSHWGLALLAVENLLNSCAAADIYNIAADKIKHGELQLKFYRKLAALLFNNTQSSIAAWHRCLRSLLALNHHILEPDLDQLLSVVWVDADAVDVRVRKAREALVSSVLQTYCKLRQLPKVFQELLDVVCRPAADELRPPLLPEVIQKSLSLCLLDNPTGQNVELCGLVVKQIQSHLLPHIIEQKDHEALKMFSLSLLLNTTLFSFKTLDNSTPVPTVKKAKNLMQELLEIVEDLLKLNLETEGVWRDTIHEATFLLTYTWVEVDTLFQIHCGKYASLPGPVSCDGDTTSLVPRVLSTIDNHVVSPLAKLLQKLLCLHMLKVHLLRSSAVTSETDRSFLKKQVAIIVQDCELSEVQNFDQIWDLQYCTVDASTYETAHWFLLISNLPLLAPYLDQNDISAFAECMLRSLLQSSEASGTSLENSGLSISIMSRQLLQSPVFCEHPQMFSAFTKCLTKGFLCHLDLSQTTITSLLLETSREENHDETANDGSASLNRLKAIGEEMINSIKLSSDILLSEQQMDRVLQLLKVTSNLNGYAMSFEDYSELFLNFFLIASCAQLDENIQSTRAIEMLSELFNVMASLLVVKTSQTILKVIYGSDLLEATITSLCSRNRQGFFQRVEGSAWTTFIRSLQIFIQSVLHLIISRKASMRLNLEKFTDFMAKRSQATGDLAVDGGDLRLLQLHLLPLSTLCREIISTAGKKQPLNETMIHLLGKATTVMEPAVQMLLKEQEENILKSQAFSVEVTAVMLKSDLAQASTSQEEMSRLPLYRSVCQQILKELCSSARPMDFLISSVNCLTSFCSALEKNKAEDLKAFHSEVLQSVSVMLSGTLSDVKYLEDPVKELLEQLFASCSRDEFCVLLLMVMEGLVASKVEGGQSNELLSTITLTKLVSRCLLPEHSSKAFWLLTPQIISALVFVIKDSSRVPSLTRVLTVPALEALTVLLRQGETHLSKPHNVIMVLDALQFVPLDCHSVVDYHAAFESIHEALFAILQCHPHVMLNASPVFLNCFYRLVSSVMREGRQRREPDRGSEKDKETLLKCALMVERMYTHIASTTQAFTILSSFIVAHYVSELQRVTLQPEIKAHLTEGIYCILDLCVEQDIKFLNTNLQMGIKEVFNELYNSYTQYHKTQRQGEEKYTV